MNSFDFEDANFPDQKPGSHHLFCQQESGLVLTHSYVEDCTFGEFVAAPVMPASTEPVQLLPPPPQELVEEIAKHSAYLISYTDRILEQCGGSLQHEKDAEKEKELGKQASSDDALSNSSLDKPLFYCPPRRKVGVLDEKGISQSIVKAKMMRQMIDSIPRVLKEIEEDEEIDNEEHRSEKNVEQRIQPIVEDEPSKESQENKTEERNKCTDNESDENQENS